MSESEENQEIEKIRFKENLEGRVANLAMSPIPQNALIPLFEAITNALDSIKEKFPNDIGKGKIDISIECEENGEIFAFVVKDNGIGLNDKNFDSFCTYDSRHKVEKGGKGVGRLVWLKSFDEVHVESVYYEGEIAKKRKFSFMLDNDEPIKDYKVQKIDKTDSGTKIILTNMKIEYSQACPRKLDTIIHKVLSHFLRYILDDSCPEIIIHYKGGQQRGWEDGSIQVNSLANDAIYGKETDKFFIEDAGSFEITHMCLDMSITSEARYHAVSYMANGRIVEDNMVGNKFGFSGAISYEDEKCFYRGIIGGEFLDSHVTQERNNFDIPKKTLNEIRDKALDFTRKYLKEEISLVNEVKFDNVKKVLSNFPKYKYLAISNDDLQSLIEEMPEGMTKEEEIYGYLSTEDFRHSKKIKNEINDILKNDTSNEKLRLGISDKAKELIEKIDNQKKYALAEYVAKRKLIIDLLSEYIGYEEDGSHYREKAIHNLICPMKKTSDSKLDCDNHNLWLIDDRLAYYDYWASDEEIKKFIKNSSSAGRPDVIFFEGKSLFQRNGPSNPIVIIEFKRPGGVPLSEDVNPFNQIYNYADKIRGGEVSDKNGVLITEVGEEELIHCYYICDIDKKMDGIIENNLSGASKLPQGRGYHHYHPNKKVYFEILNYSYLVKDAKLRNEAFFKKLDIS